MLGAIIGDISGSKYEFHNLKSKSIELLSDGSYFTDDSVMTIAIAKALIESDKEYSNLKDNAIKYMQLYGRFYTHRGYGGHFREWIYAQNPRPYGSFGNGSAMRISAVARASSSIEEVKRLSKIVTEVSHNHPEGIKGAEATAVCIYLARTKHTKEEIKEYVLKNYYDIDFTLDEIRDKYSFDVSCQGSVPQSIEAFLESNSFEEAIQNALSIGGDSDTIGAICGSIAEAYYGIPKELKEKALMFLDSTFKNVIYDFNRKYGLKD